LVKWFNEPKNNKNIASLTSNIKKALPDIENGIYPELKPYPGTVYRGMLLPIPIFLKLVNMKSLKIEPFKVVTIDKPGVLKPLKNQEFTSWSTDQSAANEFTTYADADPTEYVRVLLFAKTDDPGNKFVLNPEKLQNDYDTFISDYEYEKEVLGFGPIKYYKILVMSAVPIGYKINYEEKAEKNSEENITRFKTELLDQLVKDIMNSKELIDQYNLWKKYRGIGKNNKQSFADEHKIPEEKMQIAAATYNNIARELLSIIQNTFNDPKLNPPSVLKMFINQDILTDILSYHDHKRYQDEQGNWANQYFNIYSDEARLRKFLNQLLYGMYPKPGVLQQVSAESPLGTAGGYSKFLADPLNQDQKP
jgi:hypothetical protein